MIFDKITVGDVLLMIAACFVVYKFMHLKARRRVAHPLEAPLLTPVCSVAPTSQGKTDPLAKRFNPATGLIMLAGWVDTGGNATGCGDSDND